MDKKRWKQTLALLGVIAFLLVPGALLVALVVAAFLDYRKRRQ